MYDLKNWIIARSQPQEIKIQISSKKLIMVIGHNEKRYSEKKALNFKPTATVSLKKDPLIISQPPLSNSFNKKCNK